MLQSEGAQVSAQLNWSSPTMVFHVCVLSMNQNGRFRIE